LTLRLQGALTPFDKLTVTAIAFAVPLAVLLGSVRTSVGFWDIADLQTVVWIAGIPYPTGFPGYVAIGWVWTHAIPFASVAARLNALSAVAVCSGAAAVAALALSFEVLPVVAVLGAWTFAFANVVWLRATYADVHPVGFAIALVAIALAVRWTRNGDARALATGIVLAGIAVAVDNTTVLMLAGGVVVTLGRRWPAVLVARSLAIAALVVVVAYAYLPLRSAYVTAHRLDPTLALGMPPGRPFWDDHHPASADGFRALVSGNEWSPGFTLARLFTPGAAHNAMRRYGPELAADEPQGLEIAALIGLGFLAAGAPLPALGLAIAALLPVLFGASYQAEADPERYAFMLYAVIALGSAIAADPPVLALAVVCALLGAVVVNDAVRGAHLFATRDDAEARTLGARVAQVTRTDAVVVAPWDWATTLAYHAYVDRTLGARIVVCALPLDNIESYTRWLRDRQVTILSEGEPDLPGFRTRLLSEGKPQVYEILAP
jgi:hypothetical protein